MDTQENLMKLNACLFDRRWWLVRKINKFYNKVTNSIIKESDSKKWKIFNTHCSIQWNPVYNKKHLRTKLKSS